MIIEITKESQLEDLLITGSGVFVDFAAEWCGPCKMISPLVEELSEEYSSMSFAKVDVDMIPELAAKYGIMSLPTVAIIKRGELKDSIVGAVPKKRIETLIQAYYQVGEEIQVQTAVKAIKTKTSAKTKAAS